MSKKEILFSVSGFDELSKKIRELAKDKDKRKEVNAILMALADPTLQAAKRLSPVGSIYTKYNGKRIRRKNYVPGTGKRSLAKKIMTRSKVPMVTISPRSRKNADGYYIRQFVIPGHNIYREGFKRSKKGSRDGNLDDIRKFNATGAINRTPKNYFLDKAFDETKNSVNKKAEDKFSKFIQKRINRLSKK